jgi:hypothetical protein
MRRTHDVQVTLRFIGGALPREGLGKLTRAHAEDGNEGRIVRELEHRGRHGARIAVRNQEARLGVTHRFANAR